MSMKMELIWNADKTKIIEKKVTNNPQVGSFYSEEVARYLARYIPFKTGMLKSNYDTEPKKITYTQPYARRLYTGVNFHFNKGADGNPNASAYWERRLTKSDKEKIARAVTKMLKGKG